MFVYFVELDDKEVIHNLINKVTKHATYIILIQSKFIPKFT